MRRVWLAISIGSILLVSAILVVHTLSIRQQRIAERLTELSHCEKAVCEEYTLLQFYKELPLLFPSAVENQVRISDHITEVQLQQPLQQSPCYWHRNGSHLFILIKFRDGVAVEHCEELR